MQYSLFLFLSTLGSALAQGDLVGLLQSQPDLSTLLEYVGRVPGLADTLAGSSNITILAPTNQAFENLNMNIPEGESTEAMDPTALGGLLSNHVIKGAYGASAITDVPVFVQTLLEPDVQTDNQPFTNITGGQYIGLVRNGEAVNVLSGELSVSEVTEADIRLGEGITIHKIDTVLSFGPPLLLFAARAGYTALNSALVASGLDLALGNTGANEPRQNVSDLTVFIPTNAAFEAIGSVLNSADQGTLADVLEYHIIQGNVVFSPSLSNTSVPSLQGNDLAFTVAEDGSAWVNNAKIVLPNVILFNGVAHVIDGVLNPLVPPPDRASLDPSAPASDRVAFSGASPATSLPFTSVSFAEEITSTYTTPAILTTGLAVAPQSGSASTTPAAPVETGAANHAYAGAMAAGVAAVAGQIVMANF